MKKHEFLERLRLQLSGLPKQEVEDRLHFYLEMIEDKIEEGMSEEDAVRSIGSVEDVSAQILADIPFLKIVKEKIKPNRKVKGWEIALLVISSPIWASLLVALVSVVISIYATFFAVGISLWAVFISCVASAIGGLGLCMVYVFVGNAFMGALLLSVACVCAGLAVFFFLGCKWVSKAGWISIKKSLLAMKKCFM